MATIQRYVNTASTAGGDGTTNNTAGATRAYASLSEWEAAVSGAATDDYIVDCCGTAADTTAVTVSFATHLTTGTCIIRANASDSAGKYNGTSTISTAHYRLAPASGTPLIISEGNTAIDGLQIEASGGAVNSAIQLSGFSGISVKNCRLRAASATDYGLSTGNSFLGNGGTFVAENNLIVGFNLSCIDMLVANFWNPSITLRQNTLYGDGGAVIIRCTNQSANGQGAFVIKGNAMGNSGASNCFDVSVQAGSVTYADNAAEDAQGTTDEIAIGVLTDAWTNPGTGQTSDFTVKNTSSSLYNAVNPTLVTLDITGFTRDGTNHDVGAFEFQVPLTGPARRLSLLGIG